MRRIVLLAAAAAVCLPGLAVAQTAKVDPKAVTTGSDNVDVQGIIQKFAAKEAEFQEARNNYTYRQSVKLEELDASGNPEGGKWEEIDDIYFTPEGKRTEKVVYAPVQSLQHIMLTPEDVADLRNVQPFVLTTAEIGEYILSYLGREKLDEIGTYVFSVRPKKMVTGKRYFEGTVWVDDRDLQIVKTDGKGVGELKSGKSKNQVPEIRDLSGADRRQVLVPHLHPRRRYPAFQRWRGAARPDDGAVSGLQEVRRQIDDSLRRRGGRYQDRHEEEIVRVRVSEWPAERWLRRVTPNRDSAE